MNLPNKSKKILKGKKVFNFYGGKITKSFQVLSIPKNQAYPPTAPNPSSLSSPP
jgi:hypothetical protein